MPVQPDLTPLINTRLKKRDQALEEQKALTSTVMGAANLYLSKKKLDIDEAEETRKQKTYDDLEKVQIQFGDLTLSGNSAAQLAEAYKAKILIEKHGEHKTIKLAGDAMTNANGFGQGLFTGTVNLLKLTAAILRLGVAPTSSSTTPADWPGTPPIRPIDPNVKR